MNFSKKKLTLIANVFPKLRTRKEAVSKVFKKWRFTVAFEKQHGKGAQTHLKVSQRHLYHTYWWSIRIWSLKKSLLVIWKMLWLFVNKFTADDKFSPLNGDNFSQPIPIRWFRTKKVFLSFSCSFEIYIKFSTFSRKSWPS